MIDVSIIIGAYNAEKTIAKAIESILNQTYMNFEIIICDDCSSDDTYNLLLEYQKNYKNIKIIKNQENMGLAYSLNNCLKNCDSNIKYVARMDCDDLCLPERINKQVKFLDEHPDIDVVGSAMYIDDGSKEMRITSVIENPDKTSMLNGVPFAHPTIMMRKSTYDELGGYTVLPRTRRGQDLDLWFRFFSKNFKGSNLKEPLLIYHEDLNDYKKRTFKTAKMYFMTNCYGYKLLHFPLYSYIRVVKPLISALIPNFILIKYRSIRSVK